MSVRWGTVEVTTRLRPGAETRATIDAACLECAWTYEADLPTSSRDARLEAMFTAKDASLQHANTHLPAPRPPRRPRSAARPRRVTAPTIPSTLCGNRGCVFNPHRGLHTWQNPPPVHVRRYA